MYSFYACSHPVGLINETRQKWTQIFWFEILNIVFNPVRHQALLKLDNKPFESVVLELGNI